jgi:hypothetical protein
MLEMLLVSSACLVASQASLGSSSGLIFWLWYMALASAIEYRNCKVYSFSMDWLLIYDVMNKAGLSDPLTIEKLPDTPG